MCAILLLKAKHALRALLESIGVYILHSQFRPGGHGGMVASEELWYIRCRESICLSWYSQFPVPNKAHYSSNVQAYATGVLVDAQKTTDKHNVPGPPSPGSDRFIWTLSWGLDQYSQGYWSPGP